MCIKDYQIGAKIRVVVRTFTFTAGATEVLFAENNARVWFMIAPGASATGINIAADPVTPAATTGIRIIATVNPTFEMFLTRHGDIVQRRWQCFTVTSNNIVTIMEGLLLPDVLDVPWSDVRG